MQFNSGKGSNIVIKKNEQVEKARERIDKLKKDCDEECLLAERSNWKICDNYNEEKDVERNDICKHEDNGEESAIEGEEYIEKENYEKGGAARNIVDELGDNDITIENMVKEVVMT